MKEFDRIKEFFQNEKVVKTVFIIGVLLIAVILTTSIFPFGTAKKADSAEQQVDTHEEYIGKLEKRVENILSEVEGVGKIKVMITLENFDEDVYTEKGNAIVTTKTPVVRGIVVVCEGGDSITTKQKIVEAVSKVLGISTARVCVTY